MRKESPDFKLDKSTLNDWAYSLFLKNHFPESIELEKLTVQIYPDSSDSYELMGEAYQKSGQKQLAIESYKKCLEKDPANLDAKEKLNELESKGADTKNP